MLDVPFAIVDATTLTEAGYVGEDVENIILKLLQAADGDVARAQTGLSILMKSINRPQGREPVDYPRCLGRGCAAGAAEDPRRHGGQRSAPGGRKHPHQEFTPVDTTNILFICGGAFVGLERIVGRRVGKKALGSSLSEKDAQEAGVLPAQRDTELLRQAQPQDLIKFGLIPSLSALAGDRILDELDEDALVEILTKPRNAILKQYQRLFEYEGVRLVFSEDASRAVAREALARKVGARGLRMILEELMLDLMYHLPSNKKIKELDITAEMVQKRDLSVTLLEKAG